MTMRNKGYFLNSEKLANMHRKYSKKEEKRKRKNIDLIPEALRFLYLEQPKIIQTLDFIIHAEEHAWLSSDRKCYFFDDLETCKNVAKGVYRIDDIEPIFQGPETFQMMIPKGMKFNNINTGGGLLVTLHDAAEGAREDSLFTPFLKSLGLPRIKATRNNDDEYNGVFGMSIIYQEKHGSIEYMRCCFNSGLLNYVLRHQTNDAYQAELKRVNGFKYLEGALLNPPEEDYQYEILRLVLGFLVYRMALPERIREGYPEGGESDAKTALVRNLNAITIQSPKKEKTSPTGHYRSWHIRQLNHERYYKGEYERQPAGSRMIFVKDTYVNQDIEAATLTR